MKSKYKITLIVLIISLLTITLHSFSQTESAGIRKEIKYFTSIEGPLFDNEDFGDAPEGSYPTTLINNGARHTIVPGIFLGSMVDQEPDGQPNSGANCDDTDCLFPSFGDDEDGVVIPSSVTTGSTVNITVSASIAGFLDAWMDFNLTNGWVDAGEHIFTSTSLVPGINNLSFIVPANASPGQSYIRFRFRDSSDPISFDGLELNGEVEDYAVLIEDNPTGNIDFGDAPENTASLYPTTLANNGARHTIVSGIFLGDLVDPEPDGQPDTNANCDDSDCLFPSMGDDEDGVVIPSTVTTGSTVNITVSASIAGFLDVWIDYNLMNSWADTGEHIFINEPVMAGINTLTFIVPANATPGQSYIRFRFRDSVGNISFNGLVQNGEVEDYSVNIEAPQPQFDFGDTPESPAGEYPTTLINNGARHTIVAGIYLGSFVDAEPDGQPGIGADCDDTDCLFPSFGDDEDGVNLSLVVYQGSFEFMEVNASVDGYLDVWMDFNRNQSWADAGEHFMSSVPLTAGLNTMLFSIPANADTGLTYLRFRFRDFASPISFDGLVQNGEVEDYAVMVYENTNGDIDYGDAPENTISMYPTVFANNGAHHTIIPGIFLGSLVDPEPDGQPDTNANCDDSDCLFPSLGDDEDGVVMPSTVSTGSTVNITISASVEGFLDAWIDFNLMNSWADAGEHIFINEPLTAGINTLTLSIPPTADTGKSFIRFRFRDFIGDISFAGLVENGEVEDYSIHIVEPEAEFDFGDAPENPLGNYPTTLAFNGARHTIVPGIFLGNLVDAEPDGQPGILANCDDTDCLYPSLGDDEDGVSIPDTVFIGSNVNIIINASVDGYLDAWMDFDLNESWLDTGEHIFSTLPLVAGPNSLSFSIPVTDTTGKSYIRFRFRDYNSPIGFDGLALNGEVEDYTVHIANSQIKIDAKVILGGAVLPDWIPGEPKIMDTTLNSEMFLPLEQPYNNNSAIWHYPGNEEVLSIPASDVVDWIVLELRETSGGSETATSSTSVGKQAAFLLSSGQVVGIDGTSLPEFNISVTQNLFLVVWHRNHLGIMSANPLTFDGTDTWSYNFTSAAGQAYGGTNAQIEIAPGYFGMIPGDIYPDGQINQLDKSNEWDIQVGNSRYLSGDLNLNSQINNQDKNDYWRIFVGKNTFVL